MSNKDDCSNWQNSGGGYGGSQQPGVLYVDKGSATSKPTGGQTGSSSSASLSPFPPEFGSPWAKDSTKLQKAFSEAINTVSDVSLYPDFRNLPDVHDVTIMIVSLDGSSHQYVAQHEFDNYYSGSLVKVAALYAAFQLRIAVNELTASDPALITKSDNDIFKKLVNVFNPQIKKSVPRLIHPKLNLSDQVLLPKYKEIFLITPTGGKVLLDFHPTFESHLHRMIVGSHNESATFCIRALGYSWINGVLRSAGFFSPQVDKGIWLAGDFNNWPIVNIPTVNDEMAKQVTTCYDMAWLFTLLHDNKLVKNDLGPLYGLSGNEHMLQFLTKAVDDPAAKTFLKRPFENPPRPIPFPVLQSKIGIGNLKGGDCNLPQQNRCTTAEAAIVQHLSSRRKFVVVFQGLVWSAISDWGHYGLLRIIEIIKLTMNKYTP